MPWGNCNPGWWRVYAGQEVYCEYGCPQTSGPCNPGCVPTQATVYDVYYIFEPPNGDLCDIEKYRVGCTNAWYCCWC